MKFFRSVLIDLDSTVFNTDEQVTGYLRKTLDYKYKPNIVSYDFNTTANLLYRCSDMEQWRNKESYKAFVDMIDASKSKLDLNIGKKELRQAHSDKNAFLSDEFGFYPGVLNSIRALINLGIHVTFKTRVAGTPDDSAIVTRKYELLRQGLTGSYNHFDFLVLSMDSPLDLRFDAIFDDNIGEYIGLLENERKSYANLGECLSSVTDSFIGQRKFYLIDKSYNTDAYLSALFSCKKTVSDEVHERYLLKPYEKVDNLVQGISKYVSSIPLTYLINN